MRELALLYGARVPTILWGPPGVGKTSALEALAGSVGARLFVPHVRAPEDIAVPVVRNGHVEVVPVAEFADACAAAEEGQRVIVVIDELTTLVPSCQASALRFLDSGRVGSKRLPAHVWRSAAANPPDQAAGGYDLEPPTANRLAHVDWTVDPVQWCAQFAPLVWANPFVATDVVTIESPEWPEMWARARALVSAFLRHQPQLLLKIPDSASERGRAWPSPRTWDYASRALAAARCDALDALPAMAACVGTGAAQQFAAWARDLSIPSPQDLLANPELLRQVERSDQQYAALVAVSALFPAQGEFPRALWDSAWALAGVAAEVCRDAAAGTIVRELCRAYRDGRVGRDVRVPAEFRPYRALVEDAQAK